jgi:hypothetical protein
MSYHAGNRGELEGEERIERREKEKAHTHTHTHTHAKRKRVRNEGCTADEPQRTYKLKYEPPHP